MQTPSWCTALEHQHGGHSSRTRTKVDLSICLTLCYFKCLLVSLLKVSRTKIFKFKHNQNLNDQKHDIQGFYCKIQMSVTPDKNSISAQTFG